MKLPVDQHGSQFATTHWSMVVAAGDRQSPASQAALETLCGTYWYPLYVFARRRTGSAEHAQDLTQEFFAKLLEKNTLASAAQERGRFRSFLLTALKNFLANQWDLLQAAKRGGGRKFFSLDFDTGESRYQQFQPADTLTPEKLYQRQWALTLLDVVLKRLQTEFSATGKSKQFEVLQEFLVPDKATNAYAAAAAKLQIGEDAARQAAHRLRKRYREVLREEVAETVDNPAEVDDEIQRLFENLGP